VTVDRLVASGVGTVESLGNMTPEELEQIPEIDAEQVEQLRDAVINWYGQFEQTETVEEGHVEAEQEPLAEYGETTEGEPVEGSGVPEPVEPGTGYVADDHGENTTNGHISAPESAEPDSARLESADQAG
jgi:N utilization substance protein A